MVEISQTLNLAEVFVRGTTAVIFKKGIGFLKNQTLPTTKQVRLIWREL